MSVLWVHSDYDHHDGSVLRLLDTHSFSSEAELEKNFD